MGFFNDFNLADVLFINDYVVTESIVDELVALEDPNDSIAQERIFNKYGYSLYTMPPHEKRYFENRVAERL